MQDLNIVILAAGAGTRMYSSLPKVLHQIGGKSLLQHVIETAQKLTPTKLVIIYGHGGEMVRQTTNQALGENNLIWVQQEEQLGTGHALKCAEKYLEPNAATLLLYGDVPLISLDTLKRMQESYADNVVMLTDIVDNPFGYGRIIRDENENVIAIVEEKDATVPQKQIQEINTGIYLFPNQHLPKWLSQLSNKNSQKEYYVTDLIAMANNEGVGVVAINSLNNYESLGVNNKLQLEYLERMWQLKCADDLLATGVTLKDKTRIEVRGDVTVGRDCIIDINCIFEGTVVLGDNVTIGAGCILNNVKIESSVIIKPYSIIDGSEIGRASIIGPFSRIRPGSILASNAHVGNFVEVKNSQIGTGSKANHLTYLGDSIIGENVNIGAGSITCNYDGKNKHKTVIRDNVFVGSGTMMIAPVELGEGCVIGAGSVITKDTPAQELTVSRSKQVSIIGYLKRTRNK